MEYGRAHVMAVPYPAQGHLIPMMELALGLAGGGIKVTIVITEPVHRRITNGGGLKNDDLIKIAVIPDGLEPWEDRGNVGKTLEGMAEAMPAKVEALTENINREAEEGKADKVSCLIVDYGLIWPSELARKLKMKTSAFMTAPSALLAIDENIPKLIDQGIIDTDDGTPLKQDMIHLSPEMPAISSMNFLWTSVGDSTTQKIMFHANAHNAKSKQTRDWIICNSSSELEAGALKLVPNSLPIGPLLASNRLSKQAGYFWQEDSSCLSWLDQQPFDSTIYVSFGSSTFLDGAQFQELALALEHSNRPFLVVIRQDLIKDNGINEAGFDERIKNRVKIIKWAPQQKVLSHPSVACFLSHCGWNSTIEGVNIGVPFLCWPYYGDQFINQSYIVDHWGVGLGLEKDECGIIREEEIKKKVEKVFSDKSYKTKALQLQAKTTACVREGSSHKNFHTFMEWIKGN